MVDVATTAGLNRSRIAVAGELDLATASQLLDAVNNALADPGCRDVVIDLSGVPFIDATGIGVLVRARRACRRGGGRLTIFGAHGIVAELLHLTGVAESLGLPRRPSAHHPARRASGVHPQ